MAETNSSTPRCTKTCPSCGVTFTHGAGTGQARKFCTKACRPAPPKPTRRCEVKGCHRVAKSGSASICQTHYFRIRRNGTLEPKVVIGIWDECQYCKAPTNKLKFCDTRCAARHARGNPLARECVMCSIKFDARTRDSGTDRITCSESCSKARERERARLFSKTAKGREGARRAEYIRKARKRKAFVESVNWGEVMLRGRWRCHLCGDQIDKNLKWPDPMFGTVDHVVPLACGGPHSYANCKPAHLRCNHMKGARSAGQLGLPFAA